MSILHRRRATLTRHGRKARDIPAWAELRSMSEDDIRAMAESMGIDYTDRMKTASAINKARG